MIRTLHLLIFVLILAAAVPLSAQLNSTLSRDTTSASAHADAYNYMFPIWGKDVIARGFDIPYPVGVNVIGVAITQPVQINDFQLSFGEGNPTAPFPLVQFGDAQSTVISANTRLDLWLFPFLNVYGLYGLAQANTEVKIKEPVEFTSSVDQTGRYYGVGVTTAFGFFDHWASVDLNWTWSDLELLDEPVMTRIVGIRVGHTFPLNDKGMKLAGWVGLMNAELAVATNGSVKVADAIPPEVLDNIDEFYSTYQQSEWYIGLPKWQQAAVDQVVEQMQKADLRNGVVNYGMQKALAYPTNLLVGAQWEINKEWVIRAEAGMIGRWQALLNLNYRFRI
jgi:opacity protein-like surface antigen